MPDIYADLREIKELLVAADKALYAPFHGRAHIRKAINLADEWLEDE